MRYFTDPAFNIGGHGSSRKQVFERNGTRGDEILRHPNFHKYLYYFVRGPDLPNQTLGRFTAFLAECEPVTSGDVEGFCSLARAEVRTRSLERKHAAEEFFKLSLELGLSEPTSRAVRDSVMGMR